MTKLTAYGLGLIPMRLIPRGFMAIAWVAIANPAGDAMAQGFSQSTPRRIPAPELNRPSNSSTTETGNSPSPGKRDKCRDAFFQYALPLKRMAEYAKESSAVAQDAHEVLGLDADDCQDPGRRVSMIKLLTRLLNTHDSKLLLILPGDSGNANATNQANASNLATLALETAIKATTGEKKVVTLRIPQPPGGRALTPQEITRSIAIPFWTEKPSFIVSAMPPADEAIISNLARELAIPVVNIGPAPAGDNGKSQSARIFRLFPDQRVLAATLATTACAIGIKKVGIIRPSSPEAGAFAKNFDKAFSACGGVTATGGVYASANFEAVDAAMKDLAPALAQTAVPVRTGLVILDDARVARHVSKVAGLNGITSVTLMGHHRWRSATIVEPFDPAFEGSFFVDYLGPNVATGSSQSQFPDPQALWQAVWSETGRRAGQLALATFEAGTGYPRKNLHRIMVGLPAPQDKFFTSRTFFGPDLSAWWPTYVFNISQGKVLVREVPARI